jgi:hypothetical protein
VTEPNADQQVKELRSLRDYRQKQAQYEADLKAWESGAKGEFTHQPPPQARQMLDDPNISERLKEGIRKTFGWKETAKPEAPELPKVSAGTIDRIRISMRGLAKGKMDRPETHGEGVAIEQAQKALDDYLDDMPHMAEARADYRDFSKRIENLKFKGDISTMTPQEFEATLKDEYGNPLTKQQMAERTKAVTDMLARDLGRSASGVKSAEGLLTTGRNARANLTRLLGPEKAEKYLKAMDLIQRSTERAEYAEGGEVSPTSKEFAVEATKTGAAAAALTAFGHPHWATYEVMRFISKHIGRLNTEKEGEYIAQWVTQQKDVAETLKDIAEAANPKTAAKAKAKLPKDIASRIPVGGAVAAGVASEMPHDRQPDDQP